MYITPHLRTQRILMIDHAIDWNTFLDYSWLSEDEVQLVFENQADTSIPSKSVTIRVNPGERMKLERILAMKKEARKDLDS